MKAVKYIPRITRTPTRYGKSKAEQKEEKPSEKYVKQQIKLGFRK